MRFRLFCAALLCLTSSVRAEDNCGTMVRQASRFRATILSVEPIGKREVVLTPVDFEPKLVLSLQVESVREASSPLRPGDIHHLALRSISETFGTSSVDGTLDLEAEWMQCDGEFRRLVGLRYDAPERVIETIDGWLDVGHSYRADARWNLETDSLRLVQPLSFPYHHSGGVRWSNLDDFPALPRDGSVVPVTFELVSVEITHRGERHWLSLYELKLIDFSIR